MGLMKGGCLGVVIVAGAIGVAVYMASGETKPVVVPASSAPQATEKSKPDPVKEKFGLTEKEIKDYADRDVKSIVKSLRHIPGIIPSWNNQIKFFEYELYDEKTKKMTGMVAGVNIHNKFTANYQNGKKIPIVYSATYRYNPRQKEWSLRSLNIDGESITLEKMVR